MPRVAALTLALVAAVTLAVVFSRPGGDGSTAQRGEVFLEAANSTGEDPFTESTAEGDSAPPATTAPGTPTEAATTPPTSPGPRSPPDHHPAPDPDDDPASRHHTQERPQ